MKRTPWQLLVLILFFVYDDLWFGQEEYPITHNVLSFAGFFLMALCAMGYYHLASEFGSGIMEKFRNKFDRN